MQSKIKTLITAAFLLIVLCGIGLTSSPIVHADKTSACAKYTDSTLKSDCEAGYDRASNQGTSQSCSSFSNGSTPSGQTETYQQACQTGLTKGLSDKSGAATQQTAQNTATACQKMTNQTAKNTCIINDVCVGGQSIASATQADEARACQQAVKTCLDSGKTGTDLQNCMNQAPGAYTANTQSAAAAATAPIAADPTGECGKAQTVLIKCNTNDSKPADFFKDILSQALKILTAGVGIVAVGGIVYGAILYASARDSASQTQQAIGIIRNTAIGILLYVFMVAILSWLVPGGVL